MGGWENVILIILLAPAINLAIMLFAPYADEAAPMSFWIIIAAYFFVIIIDRHKFIMIEEPRGIMQAIEYGIRCIFASYIGSFLFAGMYCGSKNSKWIPTLANCVVGISLAIIMFLTYSVKTM